MRRYLSIFSLLVPVLIFPLAGKAMSFGSSSDDEALPTYEEARELAMSGDYDDAIDKLLLVVDAEPAHADAWNMLGFSYRNKGDLDAAWDAYEQALSIDPNHKGAHEYLGEWYLMQGDLASAKAQLAKLRTLCPSSCVELETLSGKIAEAGSS